MSENNIRRTLFESLINRLYSNGDNETNQTKFNTDPDQQYQIDLGLEKGLDVSLYAKSEFNWSQMAQIRMGLEKGLDVSIYAKPEFDYNQMFEIRKGLEENLDISLYAKPELNWEQMQKTRFGLMLGVDTSIFSEKQFEQIRKGLESVMLSTTDVSIYAKPEYDWLQMKELRESLEDGLDISSYVNPDFNYLKMRDMRETLLNEKHAAQYPGVDELDFLDGTLEQLVRPKRDEMNLSL